MFSFFIFNESTLCHRPLEGFTCAEFNSSQSTLQKEVRICFCRCSWMCRSSSPWLHETPHWHQFKLWLFGDRCVQIYFTQPPLHCDHKCILKISNALLVKRIYLSYVESLHILVLLTVAVGETEETGNDIQSQPKPVAAYWIGFSRGKTTGFFRR